MSTQLNRKPTQVDSAREGDKPFVGRFRVADWNVEVAANRMIRGTEMIRFEPKVMEVLAFLASRPGEVVTREEVEAVVWEGTVVGYDTLTGAIQKLRKAFNDHPRRPRIIETVAKKGYCLIAPVQPLDEPFKEKLTPSVAPPLELSRSPWKRVVPGAVLVLLLVVAGTLLWLGPWDTRDDPVAGDSVTSSIAVLPFDNLSGDPEQEYFADGMTDDLITALAKNSDLLVIARDSTFVYKGQPIDVREVAEKLSVRHILHGSVRRVGDQVRINVQLVDADTGSHLWAERYDGDLNHIFELQDEITQKIVSALVVRIVSGAGQDLGPPHTSNPQAYDNFLIGRQRFYRYLNKDENQKAREFFRKAITAEPNFAMGYAMLGWTHAFDVMNGWSDARERSLQRALELATRALSLQEALPVAYFVKGLAYRESNEYVKALVEAEKAIEYDPNYANAHLLLATLLYYAGRPREGLERIRKAIQINPHHPYNYTFHLGQAYYTLGRYDEAIDAFSQGIASNPASERLHVWLAAAYAQSGNIDDAEWEVDQIHTLNPDFSLERMQQTFPFKEPADREHFLDGLRKAGLSE